MSFIDSKICRFECIVPFCLVIEQNESPASITGVAINCITNLLNSSFINLNTLNCDKCIQLIGNTLCNVILDVKQKEFDQGLLLKFIQIK